MPKKSWTDCKVLNAENFAFERPFSIVFYLMSFKISFKATLHFLLRVMAAAYHSLRGPHGFAEVQVPDEPPELRHFFERCLETREFQTATSERAQVHLCRKWAEENYPGHVTVQNLAEFFGVGKSTIAYHLSRPFDTFTGAEPGRIGRPSLLSPEEWDAVRQFVVERMEMRVPCTYDDILEYFERQFGRLLNIKTLRGLIADCEDFRTVTGIPLEDCRLFAKIEDIEAYFQRLDELLTLGNIPAAFIINVDESGFNEYVDARKSVRIVPASYAQNSVPVPITRAEKRATLIAAICADGSALRPMVIVPRDTVEQELLQMGYTAEKVQMGRSDKGFVNSYLFTQWGKHTLVPDIRHRRQLHRYDGPGILIFDGFGCHLTEDFLALMEDENIVCVQLPPHTSDQLQPCDLGIFSNQKRWQSRVTVDPRWSRQTKQIVRIVDSFRLATTPKNVVAAFRKSGIVTFLDQNLTLRARVDRCFATAVRDVEDPAPEDHEGKRRVKI